MTSDDEILPEYIYVKKYFTNKLSSKELKATFTTAEKTVNCVDYGVPW